MWDSWRQIEQAQAQADREDAERREAGNVVRFPTPPTPAQDAAPAVEVQSDTPSGAYVPPGPSYRPSLSPDQRRRGLAALRKYLVARLERKQ